MCEWSCYLANVVSIFWFCFGTRGKPLIDFHFSLLTPILKRGGGTDGDDGDDDNDGEWIMFQLRTDAKR